MKSTLTVACIAVGTLLGSAATLAAADSDSPHPVTYVKDSAITTAVKTKLAAEHITSIERIHVETDTDGVVWLSGSASTQAAADKAEELARDTSGVTRVHSDIRVRAHD